MISDKEREDQEVYEDMKKTMKEVVIFIAAFNIIQTMLLAIVTVIANVAPHLELPGLFWERHKLSDLAIVEKI